MQPARRQHVALGIVVSLLGLFLALWLCPYLHMLDHQWLCVALFIVLLLVFVYGRVEIPKPHGHRLGDHH